MIENHMVLPFADDDAVSIEHCDKHGEDYEGYCPDCYLEERRRELAQEITDGVLDTIKSITNTYKEIDHE